MEHAEKQCKKLKRAYNKCFKEFKESVSNGNVNLSAGLFGTAVNPCQDYFDEYRECVVLAMQTKLKADREN